MVRLAVAVEARGLGRASQEGILVPYQLQDVLQVHVCHGVREAGHLHRHSITTIPDASACTLGINTSKQARTLSPFWKSSS